METIQTSSAASAASAAAVADAELSSAISMRMRERDPYDCRFGSVCVRFFWRFRR